MTRLLSRGESAGSFSGYNGHFSGSSITHGNKTDFYDGRGFYQGTTTQQGTPSNPLGNIDGSKEGASDFDGGACGRATARQNRGELKMRKLEQIPLGLNRRDSQALVNERVCPP
jgi:hypothetical protein